MIGFIYIMSNPAHPDIQKIGQTNKDPNERRRELGTTGVLEDFVLEYRALTEDYVSLEREIHRSLSHLRHRKEREFFKISVPEAIEKIREVAGNRIESDKAYYISPEELQRIKDEKQRKIQEDSDARLIKHKEEQRIEELEKEQRANVLKFENKAKELAEKSIKRKNEELKVAKDIRVAENMARIKEHNKPHKKFIRNSIEESKDYFAILGLFTVGTIIVVILNIIF
jgi:hypothetical protein